MKRFKIHGRDTKSKRLFIYVEFDCSKIDKSNWLDAAIEHVEKNNAEGQEFAGFKPRTAYFVGDIRKKTTK